MTSNARMSGAVTVLGTVAAVAVAAGIGPSAAVLHSLRDIVPFDGLSLLDIAYLPHLPTGTLAGLTGA